MNTEAPLRYIKVKKHHWFVLLCLLYVTTLAIFSHNGTHYPYGDGPEYLMMTESFLNHGSPELRSEDVQSFTNYLKDHKLTLHNENTFVDYQRKFDGELPSLKGYYQSTTDLNKWFSYHFWFYSLLNVPARYYIGLIEGDIKTSVLATNLFLIFFGIWLISQIKKITPFDKVALCLLLVFSPLLWYIDWAHAEVYCGVLVFVGAVFYHHKLFYQSIICFILASFQNQTISLLAIFVSIEVLYRHKLSYQTLIKLFLCNIWALLPSLFYYYWFEVGSLLTVDGTLSTEGISLKRFWHFFFDLNQGLIYGIPFILLASLIFVVVDSAKLKKYREYSLLIAIPFMSLLFMQVTNWNAGSVVMKRYGVWIAPLFIVAFHYRIKRLKPWAFYLLSIVAILSQPFVIFLQHDYNKLFWHANHLKPIAKWVLDHHPSWYNPEAEVVLERIDTSHPASSDSLIVYTNDQERVTKFFIKKGATKQLISHGVSPHVVDSLSKNLNFHLGFAQLNSCDFKTIQYNQENDPFMKDIERKKQLRLQEKYRNIIMSDSSWVNNIRKQAVSWEMSFEEALGHNIDYLIKESKNQ
ncbi:MAG: hypothetical protein RIC95_00825 [Vicingaceae bacterium]